jgi:hypothetical protein
MAEPATQPNASSSNAKPRKLKSPKEKSQQQRQQQRHKVAVSPDDAAARAVTTTTSAAAAAAATTPKDGGVLLASYDVEFDYGAFDYDAVKADEGASLWLVRAPTSVRASLLLLFCLICDLCVFVCVWIL